MHGAWGALTNLTKRQHNEKVRKAEYRYELQKRKESYINDKESHDGFDFPELSKLEIKKIKEEIRKKIKTDKTKNRILLFFLLIIIALFIGYLTSYIMKEGFKDIPF